jgi:chemotaxis protein methyltransferase CheR
MSHAISHDQLAQLSDAIGAQMGLHFPRVRWHDLERGIRTAAQEFDFPDVGACIRWLVSVPLTPHQIATLASHLTIGETYFFREPHVFAMLEGEILPALTHARRDNTRHLRLWSAGCATGEEPYSMAISISKAIPNVQDWDITLLATDINPRFQQTASEGVYREWSFRDTPAWIKTRYFSKQPAGRLAILPGVQQLVKFAYLNLVDEVYPSPLTNTMAMDVIFCRNVLMYLTPEQAQKVVHRLYHALADGGWLIVSPSETSQVRFASFQPVSIPGAILYRKDAGCEFAASRQNAVKYQAISPIQHPETVLSKVSEPTSYGDVLSLFQQGRYAEVATILGERCAHDHTNAPAMVLLSRACANQGRLSEARQWCEHALAADRLNAGLHYLRATILQEQGALDEAVLALKRALYVDQSFVLAHLALGTMALQRGKCEEAGKHFETMLALLSAYRPDEIVPESEGMTAGRLRAIIASMDQKHATR